MLQFNISGETFKFKDKNYKPKSNEIKTTSGAVFTKDVKGLIPEFVELYYGKRKAAKNNRKRCDVEREELAKILEARKKKISKEEFEKSQQ